jgi:alkanesulfonate monooxygenase SsuD/methylene tetrahydromethanopterin reductase-like flavin-dependent oxidoreductase (luciferase family)
MGDAAAVTAKLDVLRRHCAEVGRDPASVRVTHLSTALVARDPAELAAEVERRRPRQGVARWTRRVNPGTVDDHVLRFRALRAAGVQDVIVSLTGVWDSPAVERFGAVIGAAP